MAVAPVTEKKPRYPDKYHVRVNGQAIPELKTHDRAQAVESFRAEICAAMQAGRVDTIAITRGGATVATWPDPARNWDDPATFEALKQLRRGQPKLPPGSHRVRYLQLTPAQTQAALRHGKTPEAGILAMLDAESNPT